MKRRSTQFKRCFLIIPYFILAFILSTPTSWGDPKDLKSGSDITEQYTSVVKDFLKWFKIHQEDRENDLRTEEEYFKKSEKSTLSKYKDDTEKISEFYQYRDKRLSKLKKLAASKDAILKFFRSHVNHAPINQFTIEDWRQIASRINQTYTKEPHYFNFDEADFMEVMKLKEIADYVKKAEIKHESHLGETEIGDKEELFFDDSFTSKYIAYIEQVSKDLPTLLKGSSNLTWQEADKYKKLRKSLCRDDEFYDFEKNKCEEAKLNIIARPNNKIIQVKMDNKEIGEVRCTQMTNENRAYISNVSIDKKFQGQGLGYQMMNYAIKKCSSFDGKKVKALKLDVAAENFPAVKLYYSAGFHILKKSRLYRNGFIMEYSVK